MDMINSASGAERVETVVIGGGQAGLAAGYHLARRGREFVILDSCTRVGDNWRCHWDSLRLFSPAHAAALPGMRFPAPPSSYPTKDEMAVPRGLRDIVRPARPWRCPRHAADAPRRQIHRVQLDRHHRG